MGNGRRHAAPKAISNPIALPDPPESVKFSLDLPSISGSVRYGRLNIDGVPVTQPESPIAAHETLADLRVDIDRIDLGLHQLLMERGTIIDRLIAVKARQGGGSAFRPAREAAMMRALAERHKGSLPLDTVESIWRIIIATFTYVQSPFCVYGDISQGDAKMRDIARFHFGFSVPYRPLPQASEVISAVASSKGDLGILQLESAHGAGVWWAGLCPVDAPKIIARLPFIERGDHPAGMPAFVIAQPLAEAAARDLVVYALSFERWRPGLERVIVGLGGEIIANAADAMGLQVLAELPGNCAVRDLTSALQAEKVPAMRIIEVGSHAARFGIEQAP